MTRFAVVSFAVATSLIASAATVVVDVRNTRGAAVSDAVVYAMPEGRKAPPASREAIMDQKNRMFVPHVLAVQTGTAVRFPNSDNVRHQVYSFSPAKRFQLALYEGTPANPVVFDKAGVVILGCNIHDRMSAFIVVVDTPWFATIANGRAELANLPEGKYVIHVWSPEMRDEPPTQALTVLSTDRKELEFVVGRP